MALAIERHATSKLPDGDGGDNMFRIASLGFRGEALPSIGAVARLSLVSRRKPMIWRMRYASRGAKKCRLRQLPGRPERVEVRDLFLCHSRKFEISEIDPRRDKRRQRYLKRLAMAHPLSAFR